MSENLTCSNYLFGPEHQQNTKYNAILYYNWDCHAHIVSGWLKHFLRQGKPPLISNDMRELPAEVKNNLIMLSTLKI